MARAVEQALEDIEQISPTEYLFRFRVYFAGTDVPPEGVLQDTVSVILTGSDTLATLEAKRAAAIRAKATEVGASIAANQILLLTFKAG